jgi:hypothetical protein
MLAEIPFRIIGEINLGLPSAAYRLLISGGSIHNMVTSSMRKIEVLQPMPLVDNEEGAAEALERNALPFTLITRIPSLMVRTAFPSIVDSYENNTIRKLLPKTRKLELRSANSVSDNSGKYSQYLADFWQGIKRTFPANEVIDLTVDNPVHDLGIIDLTADDSD